MQMAGRLALSLSFLLSKPQGNVVGQTSLKLNRWLSCSPYSSSGAHGTRRGPSSNSSPLANLDDSFKLLGVSKDECTVEQIKSAYIELVKLYHPDARTPQSDAQRFAEIRDAYKRCMSYAKNVAMSREIYAAMEEELTNIDQKLGFTKQRRLPHRQYLTYDVGPGTFSQRQKAYSQHRLYEAMDNVYDRQFEKALRNPDAKEVGEFRGKTKRPKPSITQTLERIAHEKIRESMGRGEFKNLRGKGKPLQTEHDNPVIDDMQQKLNRLLSNAGFAPEWIALDKEIRHSIDKVKKQLTVCWSKCGPHPMTPEGRREWESELEELSQAVRTINKKINNLNLIVPSLSAQRMHVNLDWLVTRVTATPPAGLIESDGRREERTASLRNTTMKDGEVSPRETVERILNTNSITGSDLAHRLVSSALRMFNGLYDSWRNKR